MWEVFLHLMTSEMSATMVLSAPFLLHGYIYISLLPQVLSIEEDCHLGALRSFPSLPIIDLERVTILVTL